MYESASGKWVLAATVVLALAAGYDSTVSYYATLSRFLVFQPWFVLGYYARRHPVSLSGLKATVWKLVSVLGVLLSVVWLDRSAITARMLYGSYPYASLGYSALVRLGSMAAALAWVAFLMLAVKPLLSRKCPVITAIGQNTLSVYLLHGFVVRAIPHFFPTLLSSPLRVFAVLLAIVLVFGNPWTGKLFRTVFMHLPNKHTKGGNQNAQ